MAPLVRRTVCADPPTRARSTWRRRALSSVAASGSLACTSSPIRAVALCVSRSSTRRSVGNPTVGETPGAMSPCVIARVTAMFQIVWPAQQGSQRAEAAWRESGPRSRQGITARSGLRVADLRCD